MDERLEKALEFSNYRATLGVQKKNIRTRMHVLQTVHYNKGSFLADSATIAFANALKQQGKKSAVMIDTKDNPIEISDIDDFIEGMLMAFCSIKGHEVVNIASGKPITIEEVLYKILYISDHKEAKVNFDLTKPTMIPKRLIDISKIREKTNWFPKTSIDEGLKKTIEWYNSYFKNKTPEELYDN